MRKLFMFAMAAGLVFGMASCANDPKEDPIDGGVTVDQAGLRISFTLQTGAMGTRADRDPVEASTNESAVASVDVFAFTATGAAAEEGAHTSIGVGAEWTKTPGASGTLTKWELIDPIEIAAGDNMRVYVVINKPVGFATVYAAESQFLSAIANVGDMDEAGNFTMVSNVASEIEDGDTEATEGIDLVAGEDNEATVQVDRVVSKIVASENADADLTNEWTTAGVTLTYNLEQFYVVQDAVKSWVAPHYNVGKYNGAGTYANAYADWGQPATYKGTDALNTYAASIDRGTATIESGGTALGEMAGFYIGENASLADGPTAGATTIAKNGNTTYAFISTTVSIDGEATWDDTAKEIVWNTVPAYGGGTSDVFVVNYGGADYLTSTIVKAEAIETGIAVADAAELNIVLTDDPDDNDDTNGIEMSIADFLTAHPESDAKVYKYNDGWVHFIHWINRIDGEKNHFDILRNQFIHLDIIGLNATNIEGNFPGYPGEDDDEDNDGTIDDPTKDPERPTDPSDDSDPNNPDPKDPGDLVDPETADLLINIEFRPWTYRHNVVELGR